MKKMYLRKGLERLVIIIELLLISLFVMIVDSLSIMQLIIFVIAIVINTRIVDKHTHLTDEN